MGHIRPWLKVAAFSLFLLTLVLYQNLNLGPKIFSVSDSELSSYLQPSNVFRKNPSIAYPIDQTISVPFQNGALARTESDDLTKGWSTSKTVLDGFVNMYNAKILKTGNTKFPYEMWFFGWASIICNQPQPASYCDSIFYARASKLSGPWYVYSGDRNGVAQFDSLKKTSSWKPILHARKLYWDNWHNGDPTVVKVNGTYFMAYSQTGEKQNGLYREINSLETTSNESIGGAYSADGIHWTALNRPLLVSPQDGLDGAMVEGGRYARPSLIYENSKFKIWFDYWAGSNGLSMGYAELSGPATVENFKNQVFSLVQGGSEPAIAQWPNPNIIHIDDLYISASDSISLWLANYPKIGNWVSRQVSIAVSRDGLEWTVVGHIKPDSDCYSNMVPELYYEDNRLYLATGCFPKKAIKPGEAGMQKSIRIRSIPYRTFLDSLRKTRPDFFKYVNTGVNRTQNRPVCVASASDQQYLQSSETYFESLNADTNVGTEVSNCLASLRGALISLRKSSWPCTDTNETINLVRTCVKNIEAQQKEPLLKDPKYLTGKAFVDAFSSLHTAKVNGAVGRQLEPFITVCKEAQTNARNWGVSVDLYRCE